MKKMYIMSVFLLLLLFLTANMVFAENINQTDDTVDNILCENNVNEFNSVENSNNLNNNEKTIKKDNNLKNIKNNLNDEKDISLSISSSNDLKNSIDLYNGNSNKTIELKLYENFVLSQNFTLTEYTNNILILDGNHHSIDCNNLNFLNVTIGNKIKMYNLTLFNGKNVLTVNGADDNIFIGNLFENNGDLYEYDAVTPIIITNSNNNLFEDNEFINNSGSDWSQPFSLTYSNNNVFSNNLFKENMDGAITLSYCNNTTFSGNIFDSNVAWYEGGAIMALNVNFTQIINNTFNHNLAMEGAGSGEGQYAAIKLIGNNTIINENIFTRNNAWYYIVGVRGSLIFNNNYLYNNTAFDPCNFYDNLVMKNNYFLEQKDGGFGDSAPVNMIGYGKNATFNNKCDKQFSSPL